MRLFVCCLSLIIILAACGEQAPPETEAGGPVEGDAARGEIVYNEKGCLACHAIEGGTERVGPPMEGIVDRAREIITKDSYFGAATTPEEYIRESIVRPDIYIAEGYMPVMSANTVDNLTEQDVADLVEYIESVGQ